MMIDLENNFEIVERVTTTMTNFATAEIHSMKDMIAFANSIDFPAHGIILKQRILEKTTALQKGIITWDHLYHALLQLRAKDAIIIAESDMRACYNPSRMKIIAEATEMLMKRMVSACPQCGWPGFGEVEKKDGLPCSLCGEPTRLTRANLYRCKHCSYEEQKNSPDEKANPQFCDHCNP
jgi:hypothetical protein